MNASGWRFRPLGDLFDMGALMGLQLGDDDPATDDLCWKIESEATDPATGWFSHVVNGALAEWGVAPSTLRRLVQGRFHLLDAILLADAEPLPLAHYLLKKGDGPPGEWPADPPHDGSFADEHGRWRFEPGYPYPILARYLR